MEALETQQQAELASLRGQKEQLRRLLSRQNGALADLQRSLRAASSNSNLLQLQQHQLLESVQYLLRLVAQGTGERGTHGAGGGQEGAGRRHCLPTGLEAPLPRESPHPSPTTCEMEITINNNNTDDNSPNRNQFRLFSRTPRVTLGMPLSISASVSPSV